MNGGEGSKYVAEFYSVGVKMDGAQHIIAGGTK